MLQAAHKIAPAALVSPRARSVATIRAIGREAWNACYRDALEDYDYLLALEDANIAGFARHYLIVEDEGRVLACAPAFFTDYNLVTTLDGAAKHIIAAMQKMAPKFLMFKLACLGAPEIESGDIGFHDDAVGGQQETLLQLMLHHFEEESKLQGYHLIGAKDIPLAQKNLWDKVAAPLGFRPIPGMPTARLAVDFSSIEAYLATLSKITRKDMRRKLKSAEHIRIEYRNRIDDVLPQIIALYKETRQRSEFQFEELTGEYFSHVLKNMGNRAHCTLYFAGENLLAANLMLKDRHTLLDKFFCMGNTGREHNLYFVSWFTNLRYCIEHHIGCYQSGQEGYENKLRLGSRLDPNWLMFKHLNPLLNGLLRLVSPLLAMGEDA